MSNTRKSDRHYKAVVFRLYPDREQATFFASTVGCCRLVYNRYLAQKIKHYKRKGKSLSFAKCCKRLTKLKTLPDFEFLREVDSTALQQSLKDLDQAYSRFFKKQNSFPKFHKKGQKESFRVVMGHKLDSEAGKIKIGKCGWVNARGDWSQVEPDSKLKNVTVRRDSDGKWYAACLLELQQQVLLRKAINPICGIDIGVVRPLQIVGIDKHGEEIHAVAGRKVREQLQIMEIRRKRYQRQLSRKKLGSNNRERARRKVGRAFYRESQVRRNWQHQTSNKIAALFKEVHLENLNLVAMTSKGNKQKTGLNRELLRLGVASMVSMLGHKIAKRRGTLLLVDPRHTSQRCSACGHTSKDNRRSQSRFECQSCGHRENADRNAARNIMLKAA